jgi:hypothetical protein
MIGVPRAFQEVSHRVPSVEGQKLVYLTENMPDTGSSSSKTERICVMRSDISLEIKGRDISCLYSNKIKCTMMTLAYTRMAVHHDCMTYFKLPALRPFILALVP